VIVSDAASAIAENEPRPLGAVPAFGPTIPLVPAAASLLVAACLGVGVALGMSWLLAAPLVVLLAMGFARVGPGFALAFAIVLLPIVTNRPLTPSIGINSIGIILLVLAVGFFWWAVDKRGSAARPLPVFADVIAAVLFTMLGISWLASADRGSNLFRFVQDACFPLIMYAGGRFAFASERRKHWLVILLVGAAIAAVEVWIEHAAGRPLFRSVDEYLPEWIFPTFRAGSMLQGPPFAAVYFAIALAAALPLLSASNALGRFAIFVAALVLSVEPSIMALSFLLIALAVVAGFLFVRGNGLLRCGALCAALLLLSPPVRSAIADQDWFVSHALSIRGRLDLLITAYDASAIFQYDPVAAVAGTGYYSWAYLEDRYAVGILSDSTHVHTLHNVYLTMLFESGAPAAAAYSLLLGLSAWAAWRYRSDPVRLAGGLAAIALAIGSGTATLDFSPQPFAIGMFMLAAAVTPAPAVRAGDGRPVRSDP